MTTLDVIRALPRPSRPDAFTLGPLVAPGCRAALSHEGDLTILIDVVRTGTSTPRHFENLRYLPPRALEVVADNVEPRTEHRAMLACRAKERDLQGAFLRIAIALLDTNDEKLSEAVLEARLDELVSLFRALSRPAAQTVQGLWCELAVVAWSRDPRIALASWHSSARALHDFAAGPDRLEVKSCGTGIREHTVSLEQLQDAPGGQTLIASLVVEETDEGESVEDLQALVLARVAGDIELARRLETIVVQSLGRDWRDAATRRFSLESARAALRLYSARSVPTIPQPLPPEVKQVRFVVDLSTTTAISIERAAAISPFFAAIAPSYD